MKLSHHIAQSAAISPVAYYTAGWKSALIFAVSFVLIDTDHYLHYIWRRRDLGVRNMFAYYDETWERRHNVYCFSLFHTVEVIGLLAAAGMWVPELRAVAAGFTGHLLFDLYHLRRHGVVTVRALSIVEYFIRKRTVPADCLR